MNQDVKASDVLLLHIFVTSFVGLTWKVMEFCDYFTRLHLLAQVATLTRCHL